MTTTRFKGWWKEESEREKNPKLHYLGMLLPMKFGDIPAAFLLEKNFKEKGRVNHESNGKTHRLFIWFFLNIPHDCSTGRIPETIWRLEDSLGLRKGLPRIGAKLWSISFQGTRERRSFPGNWGSKNGRPTSFPTLRTNGSKLLTLKRKTWNAAYCTFWGRVFMRLQKPLKSASNWKYILLLPRKLLHLWYFLVE